ncbi:MAG: ABC transporter substrate-binding protein [Candidatus Rokubacteria bacterium]|nr:ABC transporter substrate-binding protein [Candidatus Rokubacteria bacterium]
MRLKTTWLIATAVLSILVIATRERWAQKTGKVYRVGIVFVGQPPPPDTPRPVFGGSPWSRAFLDRLADLGYVEGKNLAIDLRLGGYERLPELAAELVRLKVDVIFTAGTEASRIINDAVKTTPLVIFSCDPFEHVTRLARPDGNLTGVTCMTTELSPKRLELLTELVPKASRVVFFSDPEDAPAGLKLTQDAARRLGIKLQPISYRGRDHLPDALRAVAKERPDALFVYPDPILFQERKQIAEFAVSHRLPTMHAFPEFAEAGGLMSYGANTSEMFVMAAEQVAQILGGRRPSEVPVRQATRFHLVINLKTAKAIGLTVPRSLLLRADRIIE